MSVFLRSCIRIYCPYSRISLVQILIAILLICLPASAALPEAIVSEFQQHYKDAKERPDGLMQAGNKDWLLFKTNKQSIGYY